MPADLPANEPSRKRSHDRRNDRGSRNTAAPTFTTAVLLGILLIGAPLACGAVHRPTFLITLGLSALLALATAWLATRCRSKLATTIALAFPLFFLVTAAAQIIPLPPGLRVLLDPKGSSLLSLAGLTGAQPLSLDPPETYGELAKAAAALCVTLAALVLASGRRLRFVAPGMIASAGLLALAVGLGHRAAAEPLIFGRFGTSGGLLVGPFVNPNHTAEFLELSAFAALAFAFSRSTRDGQRLWQVGAAVLAAGALSTLSRGSVLALGAGALTWFALAPRSDQGEPLHRSRFAAVLLGLLVVVGVTIGFGGDKIVDELRATGGDNLTKLAVWKDSLHVVAAHPAGIGLGSFGRVYPAYQTLPSPSWFQFVENQPLGILLEAGIPGTVLLLALLLLVARRFWKDARRDRVEASLLAGLAAVLAHNVVDFGLETAGVLLPFCALLGALFGRQATTDEVPAANRGPMLFAAVAAFATLTGIGLLRASSARDFDALLQPPIAPTSRILAQAASLAHPTDYSYALAEARLEPRGPGGTSTQARLRKLNRAMLLCPLCVGAHGEAAQDLWRLRRRSQALLEWKTVVTLSRTSLWGALDELLKGGAKPEEMATLADNTNQYDVSRYLLAHGMIDAAKATLNQDNRQEGVEFHLVQAQIALAAKDLAAAQKASQRALEVAPRDPHAALMAAEVALLQPDGANQAIAILEKGLRSAPSDIELNRRLLALLMTTEKWQAIDQALAGLRAALAESGAPSSEANIAGAQIFERRGQFRRAMSEYQAALAHTPDNIGLRLMLARAAEQIGGITTAVDSYNDVLRRDPANREAKAALARIQVDKKALEVDSILRARGGAEDK
jgi:O-antigen ligase/tetratricopeptide (TPR) repeat protein